jgi:hypothetical protein
MGDGWLNNVAILIMNSFLQNDLAPTYVMKKVRQTRLAKNCPKSHWKKTSVPVVAIITG